MDTRKEIINHLEDFFRKNEGCYGIEMAFLYGSWAGGFPRWDSDIDIAVVFSKDPYTDEEIFEDITDISVLLSRELHSEVNVIPIYRDFRKPMLYYNAIVSGIPVFFKGFNEYVDLKNEAIFQMEDFTLFGKNWQIIITKNNLKELKHA